MKSVMYIKRNIQLINEEKMKRDFFRFIQNKNGLREIVENSSLGEMLNEGIVNAVKDESKFWTSDRFDKLFEFAAFLSKKWNKEKIRIAGINHDDYLSEVIKAFNTWEEITGLDFVVAESIEDSDIRVSFMKNSGHWSYIGRDAENASLVGNSTINLDPEDLKNQAEQTRFGIMLHEIGHSIGLIHEHQKDNSPIVWNKDQVYKDCANWYGWDQTKVDLNIFDSYNSNELFYSKMFDVDSIMIYAIPNGWSSNYQINTMNTSLSETDKKFAKAYYANLNR